MAPGHTQGGHMQATAPTSVERATATLLCCAYRLGLPAAQRFQALSIFGDDLLPRLARSPSLHLSSGAGGEASTLWAVACCALAAAGTPAAAAAAGQDAPLARTHAAACRLLGPEFGQRWSVEQLAEAARVVAAEVGGAAQPPGPASVDAHVQAFHSSLRSAGVRAFQPGGGASLEVCWALLEVQYGSPQWSGTLRRGGKLAAAAVVGAAFALAAPPADVLPGLLADLSGFPGKLVEQQAAALLQFVLQ